MYLYTQNNLSGWEVTDILRLIRPLDIAPGPGGSRMSDYAETKKLLEPEYGVALHPILLGRWAQVTIVALYESQQIPLHRDAPIVGKRYHIPLKMNDGCWCFSAGIWQQLEVGRVYRMDPTQPHGAVNWGETIRLHLMIDVEGA